MPRYINRQRPLPVNQGYRVERVETGSLVYVLHASNDLFHIVVSDPVTFGLHTFELFHISSLTARAVARRKDHESGRSEPVKLPVEVRRDLNESQASRRRYRGKDEDWTVSPDTLIEAVGNVQPPKNGFRSMDVSFKFSDGSALDISSTVGGSDTGLAPPDS